MKRRILVLVAGFAALLPFVLLPTTASWTNDAHFTATATAGTWALPVTNTCQILRPDGTARPGATCTVVSVVGSNVQDHWMTGQLVSRRADVKVTFSQTGWVRNDTVVLTLNMTSTTGLPAGWTHASSAPFSWSNFQHGTSVCSTMPVLTMRFTNWVNSTQDGSFGYVENWATQPPTTPLCTG